MTDPSGWVVALPLTAAALFLRRWVAYLLFCAWIVRRTSSTKSLHDVATAARAIPRVGDRPRPATRGGRDPTDDADQQGVSQGIGWRHTEARQSNGAEQRGDRRHRIGSVWVGGH
jgi:hypothetical protein